MFQVIGMKLMVSSDCGISTNSLTDHLISQLEKAVAAGLFYLVITNLL